MMKRKAEKQAGPVSAVAARKARQQSQTVTVQIEPVSEPPAKKPRRSIEGDKSKRSDTDTVSHRTRSSDKQEAPLTSGTIPERPKKSTSAQLDQQNDESDSDEDSEEEESEETAVSGPDGSIKDELSHSDGNESPAETPVEMQNFPLSKLRLNKNNLVYSDGSTLCIRIREKMNLTLLGQYDLWVKRGVVSVMGAKLHPSSRVYRVYAPSTHSLPVIKCVAGVDGEAEVEIKSCHSGLSRLKDISPLYQKIWRGEITAADKASLKGSLEDSRRTFSLLYTSIDDSLKRHLRPLHLDRKWSSSMKALSQRQGRLRVLICGPKASGKSTFGRYLLNHVLSPAPDTETGYVNTDGVAFLDLDPGQPEFAPMGQVYLAHLHAPFLGPPFTHPSLDCSRDGRIVRAHHIGATSPKEDPDHYALAVMDLMKQYRSLLTQYPQCPLIINYPGWIFGQGLEVATWLIKTLGLSDVVYMSEKGPGEVVEPLRFAANEVQVPLTILPSQPTDFVSRSSGQLRSMQIQSYFHQSHSADVANPLWQGKPLSRTRPIDVDYAGEKQGILGIMVMGSQINPDMLREVLEGAIVGVVAIESRNAIIGSSSTSEANQNENDLGANEDTDMSLDKADEGAAAFSSDSIIRTSKEDLPYLFTGSGSCNPLDPKASNCLGLALVRSVNVTTHKLELSTPISSSHLYDAIEQGHEIVLVRGRLDSPNWAISEEYNAARSSERKYQKSLLSGKANDSAKDDQQIHTLALLRERIRRASNVPWMTVVEDNSKRLRETAARRENSLWKLRKKAYPASDSETDSQY